MNLNEYQGAARDFAIYPREMAVIYPVLGLCGEAGEVAEKIKKIARDTDGQSSDDQRAAIAKELGDVLWYVANLAFDLGFTLDQIANENIRKLSDRRDRNVLKGSGDNR